MAGMSNIISGAILLVIVIGIYVAVTYMRNKKIVMTKKRENRLYA